MGPTSLSKAMERISIMVR
uniref:Uncharacterized protein n=1 Tax=Arundo donax TaxID=35708 RepID=A0A0A9ERF5_ARUDO